MAFLSYLYVFGVRKGIVKGNAKFWTCVSIVGLLLLGVQTYCIAKYYETIPHVVALQETDEPLTFPSVTVCSLGLIKRSLVRTFTIFVTMESMLSNLQPQTAHVVDNPATNAPLECQVNCDYYGPSCYVGLPSKKYVATDFRNYTDAVQYCRSLGGSLPSFPSSDFEHFKTWVSFMTLYLNFTTPWMDYVNPQSYNYTNPGFWIDSYGRVAPSGLISFSGTYPSGSGNKTALVMASYLGNPYWSAFDIGTYSKAACMCHCPSLQAPQNGFLIGTAFTHLFSNVSFGCESGFFPYGSGNITCGFNKNWLGLSWSKVPACLANCSLLAAPIDPALQISYVDPDRLSGSTLNFLCQDGLRLLVNGREFATCYNGTWDITPTDYPMCSDLLLPRLTQSQLFQFLNITNMSNQISLATKLNSLMPYVLSGLTYSQMRSIGFNQDDIIAHCSFNQLICDPETIVPVRDPENGMCYTVNGKTFMSQHSTMNSSSTNALRLLLHTGSSEYFSFATSGGVKVYIHDQNDPIFHGHSGFVVSPGLSYSVSLQKEIRVVQNQPSQVCVTDSTAVQYYYFNNSTNYFEEACIDSYIQAQIVSNCSCNAPTLPSNNTRVPNCGVYQYACVQQFYDNTHDSVVLEAAKYCPPACSSSHYKRTTTTSISTKSFVGNIQGINNSNGIIDLSIQYSNKHIATWKEDVSHTVVDMISDFGSSMFLLVGMSIISLMKLACLLVSWTKKHVAKKR